MARTGKRMPLDPEANSQGNLMQLTDAAGVDRGRFVKLQGPVLDKAREEGTTLWMPHWATCPFAGSFRKGKRREGG